MAWLTSETGSWDGNVAVILAHGAGQGIESPFMKFFHSELARAGFLSVMFNFEYMEQKRKIPDPQPKLQARYRSVVREVASEYRPRFIVAGGKSMGGRVASYIAHDTPEVRGLLFLGYPLHPPGKPDQLRDAHLYAIQQPMLFLSGTRDPFAEPTLLQGVVSKLDSRATLIWTEGGDHSLKVSKKGGNSLQAAADHAVTWIRTRVMA